MKRKIYLLMCMGLCFLSGMVLYGYDVSGTITDTITGAPVNGVTVKADATHSAQSDASGNFIITGLADGTYKVTPYIANASFAPVFKNVTVSGADISGINFKALQSSSVSGIELWLDAADPNANGTSPADGSLVATWYDKSGVGNNATQSTSSLQAKVVADALNGLSALQFDGVDDTYSLNSEITDIRTVFWVVRETAYGYGDPHFFLGDTNTWDFNRAEDGKYWGQYTSSNITNGSTYNGGTLVDSLNDYLPLGKYNLITLLTDGNVSANTVSRDRAYAKRSWYGEMCEIIISNQVLNTAEQQSIEEFLKEKWGPEIEITGNNIEIVDGDVNPDVNDGTDFGTLYQGKTSEHEFVIKNTGIGDLQLDQSVPVLITGDSAFTVSLQPADIQMESGTTQNFRILFTAPQDNLVHTATVSIRSNDLDESLYSFTITGTSTTTARVEINVYGDNEPIYSGDTTPNELDGTDFSGVDVGKSVVQKFEIENLGELNLKISNVTITGAGAAQYSIAYMPASIVPTGGGITAFTVLFTPAAEAVYDATITIDCNDPDENPYTFDITGKGVDNVVQTIKGLQLWLDGDDPQGDGSAPVNGALSTWIDKSGNGNDATAPAAANEPNVSTGSINGHATVVFDGSDDYFSLTSRINDVRTVFWVVQEVDHNNSHFLLGDSDYYSFHRGINPDGSGNGFLWDAGSASNNIKSGKTYLNETLIDGTTTPLPLNTPNMISLVTTANVEANQITRDRQDPLLINRSWKGNIAEIIVYNRPLSDAERGRIEAYLKFKWLGQSTPTYSISGQVTGDVQNNVVLMLAGDDRSSVITDSSGNYTFTGLLDGDHVIVEPGFTHYVFNPPTRDVTINSTNAVGVDFTSAGVSLISGTVTFNGQGLDGVEVFADAVHSAKTDVNGEYTIIDVPNGTYDITPVLNGYIFTPEKDTRTVSGTDLVGVDFSATDVYTVSGTISLNGVGLDNIQVEIDSNHTAITDSNGFYEIVDLLDGNYTVTPSSVDYVFSPVFTDISISGADITNIDFNATSSYSISGNIALDDGTPFAGVTVTIDANHSALTDGNGDYTIPDLADGGTYTLTPTLAGYAFVPFSQDVTLAGADVTGTDFTAYDAKSISGTVTYNGSGLENVVVSVDANHTALTDASGNYTITGLPDTLTHTVTPVLSGYSFVPFSQDVALAGSDVTGIDFTAYDAKSISGTVTYNGSGLENVVVSVDANHTALTDASGNYTITGLADSLTHTVTPALAGYAFVPFSQDVTLAGTDVTGIDFTAYDAKSISGTVTYNGTGLENVVVSVDASHSAVTDASGNYTISGLPDTFTYTVIPDLTGYAFVPFSQDVTLAGSDVTDIDFTAYDAKSISGTVTYNGSGLENVVVAVDANHTALTDASGNYTITGLADTLTHTVIPTLAGYAFVPFSQDVTLAGSDVTGIDFTAYDAKSISGTVTLGSNPFPGVTVAVDVNHSVVTDASGNYTITGLPDTLIHTVTPTLAGYAFVPFSQDVPLAGSDVTGIDFTAYDNPHSISGTVTLDGNPLAGVTVEVDASHSSVTDSSGNYTITGLADTLTHTVTPTLTGYAFVPFNQDVTLAGADVTGIDFVAYDAKSISGTVTYNGSGLENVVVSVDVNHSAVTDASGNYTITGLPDTLTHTVTPALAGYSFVPFSQDVPLAGSDVTGIDFTAYDAKSISGTVTYNGGGLENVVVSVDVNHSAVTDASGNYAITGLADTLTHTVTPVLAGYAFVPFSQDVPLAGSDVTGIDFTAYDAKSISGTVTYNGSGLENVVVSVDANHSALTDASGNYTITDLADTLTHTVTPSLAGYSFVPFSQDVPLAGSDVTGIDFTAYDAKSISGTVTYNGSGLENVVVSVDVNHSAVTDASGNYTITDLADSLTHTVTPVLAGYAFVPFSQDVPLAGSDVTGIDFTAYDAKSISGTVTYNGSGLENVVVSVDANHSAVTDASGNYTITGLPDTLTHTVIPQLQGFIFEPVSQDIALAGTDVNDVDFIAFAASAISGTVTDVAGNPFPGVTVSTDANYQAVSDANGNYEILVKDGDYTVTPSLTGYIFSPENRAVTIAGTDVLGVDFQALNAYSISGIVVLEDGTPLENVDVSISDTLNALTGTDGKYIINNVIDGDYTVTPSLTGYIFNPPTRDVNLSGADVPDINFTAVKVYSISGTVTNGDGTGIPDIEIAVDSEHSAVTAQDGTYVITDLPIGDYTVTPVTIGYFFTPQSIDTTIIDADVTNVNFTASASQAPTANNDFYFVEKNQVLEVTSERSVLVNDIKFSAPGLTARIVDDIQHGTLTFNSDGTFTYIPMDGYTGYDTFSYKANNGEDDSNTAVVVIKVLKEDENHPPVAYNDWFFYIEKNSQLPIPPKGVLANDKDQDGDALTAVLVDKPINGNVELRTDGSFLYIPNTDYVGLDVFSYKANDGKDDSNIALVYVNINEHANNPTAALDDQYTVVAGETLIVDPAGVMANDYDPDGNMEYAEVVTAPTEGSFDFNQDGSFTFSTDQPGIVAFSYRVFDGTDYSNVAEVLITVEEPIAIPPIAEDDQYTTSEGVEINIQAPGILENDTSTTGNDLTASLVDDPKHGTLVLNDDGSFSYTPEDDFYGTDAFTYTANDGEQVSNTATVSITVEYLKVTIGTPITVKITEVHDLQDGATFDKVPKIYGLLPLQKKGALKKDKLSFTPQSARGFWKKKFRLYDKKAVKAGYAKYIDAGNQKPLEVQLKVKGKVGGIKIDNNAQIVSLVPPEIISVELKGSVLNITGFYFGSKAPKIALEPIQGGKLIKCKVNKKGYVFDSQSGASTVSAQINEKKTMPGEYSIVLNNKIGIGVIMNQEGKFVLPVIQKK